MPAPFDPYYSWLGIPPNEQPADYYRLLGIKRFEDNREVISHAADQRMAYVRAQQMGPSARDSQRVLNDLAKAAGCLLNPRRKAMYDQHLQSAEVTTRTAESLVPPTEPISPQVAVHVEARPSRARAGTHSGNPALRRAAILSAGIALGTILVAGTAWVVWFKPGTPSPAIDMGDSNPTSPPPQQLANRTTTPAPRSKTAESKEKSPSAPGEPSNTQASTPGDGPLGVNAKPEAITAVDSTGSPPSAPPVGPTTATPTATTRADPVSESAVASSDMAPGLPKALRFRGSDRVEFPGTEGMLDFRQPFTIELWVRFAPESESHWIAGNLIIGPNHAEVAAGSVAGWQLIIQQTKDGRHRVAFSTRDGYASDFATSENAWHHIAACSDTRQLVVYVNGRRAATGPFDRLLESYQPAPIPIHLGGHSYLHANQPPGLNGDIRAFRVSSVCRYTENFTPATGWTRDADTKILADFIPSTGGNLIDVSGNARHGRVLGAQWIAVDGAAGSPVAATASVPASPLSGTAEVASEPAAPAATELIQPVPDALKLAHAREQVQQLFQADFSDSKDAAKQLALADKLLRLAAESQDDPAGRYVMLEQAQQLAIQAGEAPRALALIDEFARQFDINGPQWKAAAIGKVGELTKTTADRRKLAQIALELLDELILAGEFDAASDVVTVAISSAARAKDAELGKAAREYRDEITQAKKRSGEAFAARDQLAGDSDSPQLNLGWGRFACFYQRNWELGLPHLARADVEPLAAAAKQDLARPASPEDQAALGLAWAELVKSVESNERTAVTLRALHWLRSAESQLKGLARAEVEKQSQQLEATLPIRYRGKAATANSNKTTEDAPFQPPREFLGALGRVQVNGVDAGVLWKYESGLRLTHQSVFDVVNQVGLVAGKKQLEFVGLVLAHESMTVNITHKGGSASATVTLFVDGKPVGEVGGMRAASDNYKLELTAGEHAIRWVISGDDLGSCSLALTNAAAGQALPLYHNQLLLNRVRDFPTRARLNVNMSR